MRWTSTIDTGQRDLPRLFLLTALSVIAVTLAFQPPAATAKIHRSHSGIAKGRIGLADARALTTRAFNSPGAKTSPAAPVAPTFYGLNAQALFRLPASQWDEQLTKLAATGVGTVRFDTNWAAVEPTAPDASGHKYNWNRLDQIVASLAQHNLQGLPIVDYAAPWARAATGGTPTGIPPADSIAFAEFAQAVAVRYGPGGAFWALNPNLPAMPVRQYEIWNEENSEYFFHGTDAALYAAMFANSRAAIRAVDPTAAVIVGGLVPTLNALGWLDAFIAALPGHGLEIDGLGWHPYYPNASAVYASLKALRANLTGHGLNPPIVLTEVNGSNQLTQAALLSELALTLPRSDCNVTGMIVHTWSPLPEDQGVGEYAIADAAGNLTPAGLSYSSAVQGAKSAGVGVPAPICGAAPAPIAKGSQAKARAKKPHKRQNSHERGKRQRR